MSNLFIESYLNGNSDRGEEFDNDIDNTIDDVPEFDIDPEFDEEFDDMSYIDLD